MTRHPLYPEPGAWVTDTYNGMPELRPPSAIPSGRKLVAGEIRDEYVSYEGLGFCIYTMIDPARIEDPTLAKLWREARDAMRAVVNQLAKARSVDRPSLPQKPPKQPKPTKPSSSGKKVAVLGAKLKQRPVAVGEDLEEIDL